jgi:hypothetical protein
MSTLLSLRVALRLDENRRLEGRTFALGKEIKELRATLAEMEAARKTKTKATTASPAEDSEAEVQRRVSCQRVRVVAAVAPGDSHRASLRKEQLASNQEGFPLPPGQFCRLQGGGDQVWMYRPTRIRGKPPRLQSSVEGLYKVMTRINDVACMIQRHPRTRIIVLHLDILAPYVEALRDEQL